MKLELEFKKQNGNSETSFNRIKPTFENILNVIKEAAVNEIGIQEIFSLEWENGELVFEPSLKIKKVKIVIER
tara:strand:- start:570 stop:788 length:219 start_codon:yes stop_codon:yes gene_type:complete